MNFCWLVVKTLIEYNIRRIEKKQIPVSPLKFPSATDDNVAKAVMENETLKKLCVANVLTEVNTECSQLCSVNDPSMFADFANRVETTH